MTNLGIAVTVLALLLLLAGAWFLHRRAKATPEPPKKAEMTVADFLKPLENMTTVQREATKQDDIWLSASGTVWDVARDRNFQGTVTIQTHGSPGAFFVLHGERDKEIAKGMSKGDRVSGYGRLSSHQESWAQLDPAYLLVEEEASAE